MFTATTLAINLALVILIILSYQLGRIRGRRSERYRLRTPYERRYRLPLPSKD